MQVKYMIQWLILFLTYNKCVHSFQILIQNNDQKYEELKLFSNTSYQIPLFQTRYITIKISPNDFLRNGYTNQANIIGFKFQVKSTDVGVVEVKKEIQSPTENILLEDLFICKFKNVFFIKSNKYSSNPLS